MRTLTLTLIAACSTLFAGPALASFDWGGDCSSGDGTFQQYVPHSGFVEVGTIPTGKADVTIALTAGTDVDIQLIDEVTGTEIIAWPDGLLSGAAEACVTWNDVEYCWSGYNGDQSDGGYGNEWIEIHGETNNSLVMQAFGYQPGTADVEYSFETTPNCGAVGEGSVEQYIALQQITEIGTIASNVVNVDIELDAGGADVDVQLIDPADGTQIVAWPSGTLNGPDEASTEYYGMTITYSGYNGIDGDWGHESIEISGSTTRPLLMRAYGYQAGSADVTYDWGDGVGATCMGIATLQCDDGLYCKAMQTGVVDPAGACHTELWCESNASAPGDCSNVIHPAIPGYFSCVDYRCNWNGCQAAQDPSFHFISTDVAQCAAIRIGCDPGQAPFSNPCGCGCKDI